MKKITWKWLLTHVWNWKKILLLLCRRGEPQAVATSNDGSEEPSDSENTGACWKVKWQHMDHIAEKLYAGCFHNGLVHKPVSIQEAMKIPKAKVVVNKEWNKFMTIPAWDVKKARRKSEVSRQAKKDGRRVHFTNLMDFCHLKNTELAKHLQKYKERVRSGRGQRRQRRRIHRSIHRARCFTVSDDSGNHHLKASRYGWRNKWRNFSVHSGQNDRSSQIVTVAERKSIWQELDHQTYYGLFTFWLDQ